jgi:hypothetical protein
MLSGLVAVALFLRMEVVDFLDFPLALLTMVIYGAMMVLPPYYRQRFRERAARRDHVVAVERDVAIPLHCVGCGNPHATHPLQVRAFFNGVSPFVMMADRRRFPKDYLFHACLDCVRPIRRRRRLGRTIMIAGCLIFAHMVTGLLILPMLDLWRPLVKYLSPYGLQWLFSLETFVIEMYIGGLVVGIGFWVSLYSPAVHILDTGGEKLFFSFRSQRFRDAFAQLNGES